MRGLFDDSQIEAESQRIDSEIQRWTVFLRQAERQRGSLSVSNAESAAGLLASVFAEFEFLSVKDRKKLLRQFIARVYVRDGAIVKLALRVPSSSTNLGIRTGADAQFVVVREIEITLEKPYTKHVPTKCNRFGIPEKNRYRTGDLCPLLGVGPDTLRWRLKTRKYPEVARDGKGRIFALADIERILAITKESTMPRNRKQEEVH